MDYRIKMPESKEILQRLKQSAKKRNISFDLTLSDINNLSFPITCPVLGIPLRWNRGEPKDDSYSFDRIDSSLGYTIDNIEVISFKANRAKNNLNEEEMKKFCIYYS
jgi:hypothetical protein